MIEIRTLQRLEVDDIRRLNSFHGKSQRPSYDARPHVKI
jgi:hypothetical protein